jgi:hypothetical protein
MSSTKPKLSNLSTQRLPRSLGLPALFPGAEAPTSDVGVEALAASCSAEAPRSAVGAKARVPLPCRLLVHRLPRWLLMQRLLRQLMM